ncbi:hypothetical protein SGLAM104S_07486 [Streptomyces glaucescens]
MATITATPARTLPALLRNRAAAKLAALALVALVLVPLAHARWASGTWPDALTVDLSGPLTDTSDWIIDNRDSHPLFLYFFGHVSNAVVLCVRAVYLALLAAGWAGVTALCAFVAWRAAGVRLALGTAAAFLACGLLGMWMPTLQTLALMAVAVLASVAVGALLGLAAGLSDRLDRMLRPVLDTMQVLPAFAYLLPVVLVFGIGVPAAVLATVVYAAPPMARLTALGLRGADRGVLEAVESLGATSRQRLLTARIPLARKELLLGVNQTIMMALSMAVIASVIGAGGLGDRVYQALASVDVGAALAAGIPIVLLAVVLDRVTGAAGSGAPGAGAASTGRRAWPFALGAAVAVAVAGRLTGRTDWPDAWTVNIAEPVNRAVDWMTGHLYTGVPVIGGTADWAGRFTTWVLDPLRDGLQWLPWWSVLEGDPGGPPLAQLGGRGAVAHRRDGLSGPSTAARSSGRASTGARIGYTQSAPAATYSRARSIVSATSGTCRTKVSTRALTNSRSPAAARTPARNPACSCGSLSTPCAESSRLQPTAPASSSRSTSSPGASPYPSSTSADTGTSTARAIRATAANISSAGVSPSA